METIAGAIIAALAAGATVALKEAASQTIKESYQALKALIGDRLAMLARLESNPSSATAIFAATEEAEERNLAAEPAILEKARELSELIAHEPPDRLPEGIDLEGLRAGVDILVKGNRVPVRARYLDAGTGRIDISGQLGKLIRGASSPTGPAAFIASHWRAGGDIVVNFFATGAYPKYARDLADPRNSLPRR